VSLGNGQYGENFTYDLLSCPERFRFPDCWRQSDQSRVRVAIVLWSQGTIKQLEVLFPGEERVLAGHPNTGYYMILDETTQRVTRRWHKILIIGVGNEVRLSTGNVILCGKWSVSPTIVEDESTHEESGCSSLK
jgi:hypothetical protein